MFAKGPDGKYTYVKNEPETIFDLHNTSGASDADDVKSYLAINTPDEELYLKMYVVVGHRLMLKLLNATEDPKKKDERFEYVTRKDFCEAVCRIYKLTHTDDDADGSHMNTPEKEEVIAFKVALRNAFLLSPKQVSM